MGYYFVRVAGKTGHNNPSDKLAYVPSEPPNYPKRDFNYCGYCLRNDFVRIGWPGVGDLTKGNKQGALDTLYSLDTLKPHIRKYLLDFSHITLGSTILMPDKDKPGDLYIGQVNKPYSYFHNVPIAPYECAHRLGVAWVKSSNGVPVTYKANDLGINIVGGWWLRAFYTITDEKLIESIEKSRKRVTS